MQGESLLNFVVSLHFPTMNSGVLRGFVLFCEVYFWRQPQSYRNLGKSVTAFFPEPV